jgi:hypothetical protein
MLTSKVLSRLLLAIGQPGRTVRIALVTTPVLVAGYAVGLPGGPNGVAAGFSVATFLLAAPVILWAIRGTIITGSDMLKVVLVPSLSVITAAAATLASPGPSFTCQTSRWCVSPAAARYFLASMHSCFSLYSARRIFISACYEK